MDNILFPVQSEYLKSFRYEKDQLILEMEAYAVQHNIPILSWQSAEFMEQLVVLLQPKRVLEIGTAIAYTTIRIARFLKKKSVIHTIEKSSENIKVADQFIQKSGMAEKIKIHPGEAIEVMPQLEKKYDLIFLDADKNDYKSLFDYSMVLLKRGGVIFVDNLLWHGYAAAKRVPASYKNSTRHIKDFNSMFMNHKSLKSSILPVGDGIGLGIKL